MSLRFEKSSGISNCTTTRLAQHVPPAGTSLSNPVDVSLNAHMDMNIFARAAEITAADAGVDAVCVIGSGLDENTSNAYIQAMIRAQQSSGKPFLIIGIAGKPPDSGPRLCSAGVPFFEPPERAMAAYAQVVGYYGRRA